MACLPHHLDTAAGENRRVMAVILFVGTIPGKTGDYRHCMAIDDEVTVMGSNCE